MINLIKKGLVSTWRYRPIRDPLKSFFGGAFSSAENISGTYTDAARSSGAQKGRGDSAREIVNSFTDEQCREHYNSKAKTDLASEYRGHQINFYLSVLGLIYGINYALSQEATMTILTLVTGPAIAFASLVYIAMLSWRCWQARVGGNYQPSRFIAALLRNPFQVFP